MNRYEYIAPGTRVGIYMFGVLRHEGIAGDGWINGEQSIISRSRRAGRATEEPISVFADGYAVVKLPPLSDLHLSLVVANARRLLGTPWKLTDANCEHFVYECFGLKPESPQLQGWISCACAISLLVIAVRSA